MNPQDDQQSSWQPEPAQPAVQPHPEATPQSVQPEPLQQPTQSDSMTTDYPTETYQPAEPQLMDQPISAPAQAASTTTPEVSEPPVYWTAIEDTQPNKGPVWYVIAAIVVAGLIAADFLFLKSYTFSVLVVIMAVAFVIYSRRTPREINYTLSGRQGLYIGDKLYHLTDFRSFGIIEGESRNTIMLIPVKRFSPGVSIYFPEEVGEQIVDILGQRLPMETITLDFFDVIIRKMRL